MKRVRRPRDKARGPTGLLKDTNLWVVAKNAKPIGKKHRKKIPLY